MPAKDLVPLQVYVEPEVKEEVEKRADAADRTTSAEARRLIKSGLLVSPKS